MIPVYTIGIYLKKIDISSWFKPWHDNKLFFLYVL